MKIKYQDIKLGPPKLIIVGQANKIIAEYQAQGYQLTLRQLYYQFVARDLIANKVQKYKWLGSIVNDARLAGLISWHAIEDRTRNLQGNTHWSTPSEIINICAKQYREEKWAEQPNRIEVWIEKDALAGVIEKVCKRLDVNYFSCRGYTSQSEMWAAAQRLKRYERDGQETIILHFGDHDPSGCDMTRDIEDRLAMFGSKVEVKRMALNMEQIDLYNPPPNPAKSTDGRYEKYVEQYGDESWELDALEPKVLEGLIEDTVLDYRDEERWLAACAAEDDGKKTLAKIAEDLDNAD